jgi:hypothetical protein
MANLQSHRQSLEQSLGDTIDLLNERLDLLPRRLERVREVLLLPVIPEPMSVGEMKAFLEVSRAGSRGVQAAWSVRLGRPHSAIVNTEPTVPFLTSIHHVSSKRSTTAYYCTMAMRAVLATVRGPTHTAVYPVFSFKSTLSSGRACRK